MRGLSSNCWRQTSKYVVRMQEVLISGVEKETHENNTVGIVYAVWSTFPPVN